MIGLVEEVDYSRYTTGGDHDEAQTPEGLEIDAVKKAHDGNADPTHEAHDKGGQGNGNADDGEDGKVEALAAFRVGQTSARRTSKGL